MKNVLSFSAALLILTALLPLLSLFGNTAADARDSAVSAALSPNVSVQSEPGNASGGDFFKVLLHERNEVISVSVHDYIFGVLAAEISPDYPDEAIKAQAVAAHTFAQRRKKGRLENPPAELSGGEISDDSSYDQGFLTRDEAQKRWGDSAKSNSERFDRLISEVENLFVYYNGELANTVYHAISPGKTLSSEEAWGTATEYLIPVESVGDLLCSDYISEKTFSRAELYAVLSAHDADTEVSPEGCLADVVLSPSGSVISASLGYKSFSGTEIRSMFSLRSSAFDLKYDKENDSFTFTVRGSGHGVGMSQNGASVMASQGSDFKQILTWYYPGCTVQ